MLAIDVQGLTRRFGDFVAVDDISFSVEEGEIFGFLGANGAGKTTAIRMLCGILSPSGGRATVSGFDIETRADELKMHIGYMSQRFSLYDDLTVAENIEFFGGIYRMTRQDLAERSNWVIEMAGLTGKERTITGTLPGGWKQRLALGCAVMHRPKILFLDEPTAGVDPISRRRFWDLIYQLSDEGVTVLVTTHYMDEAEHCDRLTLMEEGKIIAEGKPSELKETILAGKLFEISASPFNLTAATLAGFELKYLEPFGLKYHAMSDGGPEFEARIAAALDAAGCVVESIRPVAANLEDVFLAVIGGKQKEAGQ
jgi:drug efflux transport system ATP-binding protein